MGELRVDGDVRHVQNPDVRDTIDLHWHSESAGRQIFPPDFENFLAHVVVSLVVFDAVGQTGNSRQWRTEGECVLWGDGVAGETGDDVLVSGSEEVAGEPDWSGGEVGEGKFG